MSDVKNIPITDIEEFDSVDVIETLVKAGDEITVDQPLVTIESEKAMMDYPSPLAGIVEEVIVQNGGKIKEGDILITLKLATQTESQTDLQADSQTDLDVSKQREEDLQASSKNSPDLVQNEHVEIKQTAVSEEVKNIPITDIEEFESVDVIETLVKAGDEVTVDQPLVTIESEKAMMDYPSPLAGIVAEVIVQNGGKIKEGDILITLKVAAQAPVQQQAPAENPPNVLPASGNHTELQAKGHKVSDNQAATNRIASHSGAIAYASPDTNKYARELGVNLDNVQGSGRNQRIIKGDVQQHVREQLQGIDVTVGKPAKALDFSKYGESSVQELTKIQKLTAENMLNSWQSIPHVTHFDQADVTQLELHRKQLANELKAKEIKLTPLVFVVKALVATLKKFPQFNCSLDTVSETLVFKEFFHIGIAVDTEYGLFVPVLRDADKKSVEQLAQELVEIGNLAKQRQLRPKHMGGASMTISSLGNLGGQSFTPIINPPEVAILGLSKMVVNKKMSETGVEQNKLLPLSLSYDHRVINGADAAKFCTQLKNILEDIWKLIL